MIVADTNLIVHLFVTGSHTETAEAVLRRDADWRAPRLWQSELRHVLWKLDRRQLLTIDDATGVAERAERLVRSVDLEISSPDLLRVANQTGCSPYDCEFAILAAELGCPLVTFDKALLQAFPMVATEPQSFARD